MKKTFFASKQQMGIAALIMGISILISRFMGLFRDKVISWQFGASGETDLYFTAFVLPDFLNYLLAGGYVSITLIPLLSRLFTKNSEKLEQHKQEKNVSIEIDNSQPDLQLKPPSYVNFMDCDKNIHADAWHFFGTILTWATCSIGALSLLAWIFARDIAPFLAPGFSEEQLDRLVYFLRIILPAQICFLPGACFCALLYVRKQFLVPALIPLIYNGFILLCGILFPYFSLCEGMDGFCYGVLFGAFIGSFLLPYLAVKSGGIVWCFSFYHPLMKRYILLALPLMLGQSIVVLDEQFIRIFGSLAGDGAVSLLSYARRIMMVPVGVVAQAAGVASFPFLATLLAKNDMQGFNKTLQSALSNSFVVVLPITFYMVVVAKPTLGFLFEGGQFTHEFTSLATPLLQVMLLSVPFWLVQQIIGRAFYAMENTLTPAIIGSIIALFSLPFYYLVTASSDWYALGALGVALITSICVLLYAFILYLYARKKFEKAFEGVFTVFMKNSMLSLAPTMTTFFLLKVYNNFMEDSSLSLLFSQFLQLFISGLLFLVVYLVFAKLFIPANIDILLSPFKGRRKS